ncbi:hypothetical protein V495_02731 [Pseudogymnoascus sp. VKM F-4514 (FW-929)]|nr:hypothetical protein V495_02731 [Pseudogymnoascus sp. VKM F-4514 (FW-929)]KFY62697.1 hypothetical protein V497_02265 [Pseudogymnoascus sp. VKM F-4516 (FW-969)]
MADGEDPLDLSRQDICNGPCWMFGMIMCCVGFDWFIVMLQHSRIRATYNIDGTAGGDCVQSLFCSRCTLMQDEWEIVAREERILLERKETEINRQPGQQQQMRYSISNLFEEVPEAFRPVAASGGKIPAIPRVSTPDQETHVGEPLLQDAGHREHPQHSNEGVESYGKARQAGHGPRKLAVRKSSPIGSALNPITRRSSSVDLGRRSSDSKLPQRSATNPARPSALVSPVRYPSPNFLGHGLKGKATDGMFDITPGFGTIKEEAKSEDFNPSIRSDVGVKSFALGSMYSGSSLRQGRSDARADESVIVYYDHDGRPQHHRFSDLSQSRPLTPELNDIQVTTLDGVAGRLESVDEDDGNGAECNCSLDSRQAEDIQERCLIGEYGDRVHGEQVFDQPSTPNPTPRRFSISPSEMVHDSSNIEEPISTSKVTRQDDCFKPDTSLGRTGSLIRYLVDVDKFFNIPTEQPKDQSNFPEGGSDDPSNDSFKSIIEVSSDPCVEGGDIVSDSLLAAGYADENLNSDAMKSTRIEGINSPVADDCMEASKTAYRLQHREYSGIDFADSTSKALDNITDDWIEVSSAVPTSTSPGVADLSVLEQSVPDKGLVSDDCDFISAEQHMSDVYHVAEETMDDGHMTLPVAVEIASEAEEPHGPKTCGILSSTVDESTAEPGRPTLAENTPKSDKQMSAAISLNTVIEDQVSVAAIEPLGSASQKNAKDKSPRGMRQASRKSRNRRNRRRRAAAEEAKVKSSTALPLESV